MVVADGFQVTIGYYLLKRIRQLGCKTIHGVPGDFNLAFLDIIDEISDLKWSGNCNEINAAYAADGYARISGTISALVTTFGVGELGALPGIAGSFCEYVPTVHIVGTPSLAAQASGRLIHHNLDTDFTVFQQIARPVSTSQAIINDPNLAAALIDNALRNCAINCKPVYIALPTNLAYEKIDGSRLEKPLDISLPDNDPESEAFVLSEILTLLLQSKKPIILVDAGAMLYRPGKVMEALQNFIDKAAIPAFTTPMGKSALNEYNPNFGGTYIGTLSIPAVKKAVEDSDLILHIGAHITDLNTGSFSYGFGPNQVIEFHYNRIKIRYANYPNIAMKPVIQKLTKFLDADVVRCKYATLPKVIDGCTDGLTSPKTDLIEHSWFWPRMQSYFRHGDIILSEAGTAMFGLFDVRLPKCTLINQVMWSAIGYTVGATLGAALASMDKEMNNRVILLIGDGSLQMTVQELSTMIWRKCNITIFVINNDGYTVERLIHGQNQPYNDINPKWKYTSLLDTLGGEGSSSSFKVSTPAELDNLLIDEDFASPKHMQLVEVMMPKMDAPRSLKLQAELLDHSKVSA